MRDNGIGIPAETKDRLFQPFFTTKPTGEGTGLGLSITYDIVTQQYGDDITVDSKVNTASSRYGCHASRKRLCTDEQCGRLIVPKSRIACHMSPGSLRPAVALLGFSPCAATS